jgi:hypothetical protein
MTLKSAAGVARTEKSINAQQEGAARGGAPVAPELWWDFCCTDWSSGAGSRPESETSTYREQLLPGTTAAMQSIS